MNITEDINIITLKNNKDYIGSIKYSINNNELFIDVFYILSKYRGHNYGQFLLDYIIKKSKDLLINKILLNAKEYYSHYDKLINYYKKFGFEIDKESNINQKWVDGELVRIIKMYKNIN